jgi:hypothetical protein
MILLHIVVCESSKCICSVACVQDINGAGGSGCNGFQLPPACIGIRSRHTLGCSAYSYTMLLVHGFY